MSVNINTNFDGNTPLSEWYPIVKSNEKVLAEAVNEQEKALADDKEAADVHKTAEVLDHPDGCVTAEKIADGAVLGKHYWQPLPAGYNFNGGTGVYNGFYYFDDSTSTNAPEGCTRGILICLHSNGTGLSLDHLQIVIDVVNSKIYKRWAHQGGSFAVFDEWEDVDEIPIASLDTLGNVKLYGKSVNGVNTNRSGLSIGDDGSILVLVKANGGLAIDGVGQLYIVAATDEEVEAGTDVYKPVTSATLKKVVDLLQDNIDRWSGIYSMRAATIDSAQDGLYVFYGSNLSDYPYDVEGILLQVNCESLIHQIFFRQDCTVVMRIKTDNVWGEWKNVAEIPDGSVTLDKLGQDIREWFITFDEERVVKGDARNQNLNEIYASGIYSASADTLEQATQYNYPPSEISGSLIVCENKDGVSQIFVNEAVDGSRNPRIYLRSLISTENGMVPQSDWHSVIFTEELEALSAQLQTEKTARETAEAEIKKDISAAENSIAAGKTTYIYSSETTASITPANNTEYRFSADMVSLTVTLPAADIPEDYAAYIVFTSGETATEIIYPDSLKWSGDDVIDGVFTPLPLHRYNIGIWYDGAEINAVSRSVSV
ncbi:MAG: pyocin knob domain-containing protein [Candidatus Ornithomonoglobus sp.]